jgi:hypothetical protein
VDYLIILFLNIKCRAKSGQNLLKICGLTRIFTIAQEIKWIYLAFRKKLCETLKHRQSILKKQLVNPITP